MRLAGPFLWVCPYFPLHTSRGYARVRARSSLTFCISVSTEGSPYGDVGAWIAWRMRTFFIPCLASCIIFMPNRGEMVFSTAVSATAGEKEIYCLRGERRDIYIILLQFALTVYRSVFKVCRGKKKRGKVVLFHFLIYSRIH